ncbi:MAG TPA: serine/threonine-protein kinase, partial [Rhodanobacteraceae bacterium]|nr:serine/threonine-protein kinase [Rhodanobacteraceae bacterium]
MNDASDANLQQPGSGGASLARLRALFDTALDVPHAERVQWLAAHVPDAVERETLARLLAAADEADRGFLDTPVGEHASKLGADSVLAESFVGQRIGAFRLVRLLGKGGMAAVFLGQREGGDFRQDVAIKLLRRGLYSEIEQRLFLRERRVLASLNHPNIARLFDGGLTDAGVPYLVMEYVDGLSITRHATERALDLRARLDLFLTVCRAVEAAHRALIVHRDIKPSNILVAGDGTVKLLDFGIAKLLEDNVESGTVGVFTPDYAAPEQISAGPITTATDVYALGVLLHELLLGARPGPSTATLRKRLRGDLDNVLMKALDPEPERRYASAGAFSEDIERHLAGQPVAAHPPSRWYRARKFVARHKGGVVTTAAFLVAILASLGLALWQANVAREQARVAHEEAQRADAVQSFLVGVFNSNSSYQDDPAKARSTTAEQLLEIGAKKIDGAMSDTPDAKVRMLHLLADLHGNLGLDEQATTLLRKAVDVARSAHGEHAIQAFDEEMALADALHSANSDEAAKAVLEDAQATLDASRDASPRRRAQLYDQLGEYYATRDAPRALDYARKSIALYDTLPPSYDFAFALSRKARAERYSGLDSDAIASYRRAIEMSVAIDGERSPDLPRYYAELADIQTNHHDIAGGEDSVRRALASAKAIHGENHVDVAQCEVRLGRLLFDTDRVQEGFALIESARAKTLALRGPDDGFHTPLMLYQHG